MKKEHLIGALAMTVLVSLFFVFMGLSDGFSKDFGIMMAVVIPASFVISYVTFVAMEAMDKAKRNVASYNEAQRMYSKNTGEQKKDASVVGRAVAGGVVAGPVGAVVGALSAVDKNNKNRNNNSSSK